MNRAQFFLGLLGVGVGMFPFLVLMGVLPSAPQPPTLLSWVAFGPGERDFIVSGGGLAVPAGHGGDIIGRVLFGFGIILGWFMLGCMVLFVARRWLSRR